MRQNQITSRCSCFFSRHPCGRHKRNSIHLHTTLTNQMPFTHQSRGNGSHARRETRPINVQHVLLSTAFPFNLLTDTNTVLLQEVEQREEKNAICATDLSMCVEPSPRDICRKWCQDVSENSNESSAIFWPSWEQVRTSRALSIFSVTLPIPGTCSTAQHSTAQHSTAQHRHRHRHRLKNAWNRVNHIAGMAELV